MLKYFAQTVNSPPLFIVNPLSLVFSRISTALFFIPLAYKRSLVSCLVHRMFNLCSTYENFHAQLEVVRKLFNLNGFPSHMFDHLVRRFFDNMFDPKPTLYTVPKKIVYFCLPFIGSHSLQIRNQITRLCNAAYPHLNIRFVFRSSTRISSFFPFKGNVPKLMRSGVVYLFKCRCCSASYVGQTTRHLHTRISEHLGIYPITGKPSSSPVMSSIFSHLNSTGHSANFDDFEILSSCSDTCELMIHESLLISKLNPLLTCRAAQFRLTFYNCFLCLSFLSPCCIVLLCTILTFLSSFILNTL